jgi:hypothetical protein
MNPATGNAVQAVRDRECAALEVFDDATPDLLEKRLLQQRVDRKFALSRGRLLTFLDNLDEDHRLLRAAGVPAATYETSYFDTADRRMYEDHRRGRMPRYKVRVRHQLERQMTFLEIKRKGHDGRTCKARMPRQFRDSGLDDEAAGFIGDNCPVPASQIRPVLWLTFRRATLLAERTEERLTIDWDFAFRLGDRTRRWPHVAIVEIKQPRYHHDTPAVRALRRLGVRETPLSKYCVGIATLAPVRSNTFKPMLRELEYLSV